MLNNKDQENLINADCAAKLLVKNLDSLAKSSNPLLASAALKVLQQATEAEKRLQELLISVDQS